MVHYFVYSDSYVVLDFAGAGPSTLTPVFWALTAPLRLVRYGRSHPSLWLPGLGCLRLLPPLGL